jgi:DNA repair protein RecO (recombination protein O)
VSGDRDVVRALVVGGVDFGEADRVVHLLTAEGRSSVFAHGARKSRRRFAGAIDAFVTIDARLEPRRGRGGLATLAEATVRRARLGLRDDLGRVALAAWIVELSAAVAPEGQEALALLELAESSLDRLEADGGSVRLRRCFELRLLDQLGTRPQLDACVRCGRAVPEVAAIDLDAGGLLCADDGLGGHRVGPRTVAWMSAVLDAPGLAPDGGADAADAERAARSLERPMSSHLRGLIGRPLKAAGLLAEIER